MSENEMDSKLSCKKIGKFKTELPKKGAFTIETDPDYPKLHCLCIASGKRGSGKSCAVTNFVKDCKDKGYFDRVWLITPTYYSNKGIWDIADIQEDDILEPSITVIKDIIALVEAERAEWDLFLQQKELYKKFKKDIKSKPITRIDDELLLQYQELDFFEGPPTWKYKNEVPPRLGVIIDDCLSTPLMSKPSAGLTNLIIKHRHIAKGLGISIFMLVQSYKCQGGLSRVIRENCTMLMLFKINQEAQIKAIHQEADCAMSEQEFVKMCEEVHSEPHQFLLMDFAAKDPAKKYRKGWDQYILAKTETEN